MNLGKLYIDSKTGRRVISNSVDICVKFVQYEFTSPDTKWVIPHVYDTRFVVVQSFSDNSLFIADDVVISDSNTITLYMSSPMTGFCNVMFYTRVGCECIGR